MSDYYNKNSRRKKRSRREKIGFYAAFSICLLAVCMAVYSTYNTISNPSNSKNEQEVTTQALQVNEYVTGVTETPVSEISEITEPPVTISSDEVTQTIPTEKPESATDDALKTMLSTDLTLSKPVKSGNVIRQFSKESTYYKTLNVWKPHMAVDFEAELGDDVLSMTGGTVTDIKDDKMYGKTVELAVNDVVCIYSGLGSVDVAKGDNVKTGDKIGTVGAVPFEASDSNHIHVAIRVDGKYADPLSFIGNNE